MKKIFLALILTFSLVLIIPSYAASPTYSLNSTNNTGAGQPTLFSLNWTSNTGLSGYIFSTNNSGSWVNNGFNPSSLSSVVTTNGTTDADVHTGRKLVQTSDNTLHLVYWNGTKTLYKYSNNDGITWSSEIVVGNSSDYALTKDSNDNLHFVFGGYQTINEPIFYRSATVSKASSPWTWTWNGEKIAFNADTLHRADDIAVDSNGIVHMHLGTLGSGGYAIWLRYNGTVFNATNIGNTFAWCVRTIAIANNNDIFMVGRAGGPNLGYIRINNTGTQSWAIGSEKTIDVDATLSGYYGFAVASTESPQRIYILESLWSGSGSGPLRIWYANVSDEKWYGNISAETANVMYEETSLIWGKDNKLHFFYVGNFYNANYDIFYRNYDRVTNTTSPRINITNNNLGNRIPHTITNQVSSYIPFVYTNGTSKTQIIYTGTWQNTSFVNFENQTGTAVNLTDGFESGDYRWWNDGTAQGNAGQIPVVQSSVKYDGTNASKHVISAAAPPAGQSSYSIVTQTATLSNPTTIYLRAYVQFNATPLGANNFTYLGPTIDSSGSAGGYDMNAPLIINKGGTMYWGVSYWRTSGGNVVVYNSTSSIVPTAGVWYYIEAMATQGSGTGEVAMWVNGTRVIDQTGINNTGKDLERCQLGPVTNGTLTAPLAIYLDDVVMATSYIGPYNSWSNVTKTLNSTIGTLIQWKVYANDTSNNWNASLTYSLTTTDGIPPTYSKNTTNTTWAGYPCNFSLEANDNAALQPNGDYLFSTNNTGTWKNTSWTSFTATPQNMTNVTTLNSTVGTNVAWCFYFNDSAGNMNNTNCQPGNQFILTTTDGTPPQYYINSTDNTQAGQPTLFSLNWTDNAGLSGYIFQFCNGTWNGTDCLGGLASPNWADSNCNYRRSLSFTKPFGTENLTNFPVLAVLNSTRINYASTNQTDIRFYDADNTTLLYKETELWNSSGNSYIWVNVPQLYNNTQDFIWAYYNCSNSNSDNKIQVWNNNYSLVYHFNEISGNATDSTLNAHTANKTSIANYNASGKVDSAFNFDGSSSIVNISTFTDSNGLSGLTVEAWIKPSATATSPIRQIVTKWTPHAVQSQFYFEQSSSTAGEIDAFIASAITDGGSNKGVTTNAALSANNWYHVAFAFNGSAADNAGRLKIYVNGTNKTVSYTGTIPASLTTSSSPLSIGGETSLSRYFYGIMDEVRVSNTSRSLSWINASYLTESDNLITYGSEEQYSAGGGWVNNTWNNTGFSGTSSWSNVTKTVNSTIGATIAWCVYANDTSGNWNGTSCSSPFNFLTTSGEYSMNFTGGLSYSNGLAVANAPIKFTITYNQSSKFEASNWTNSSGYFLVKLDNLPEYIIKKDLNITIYVQSDIEAVYNCHYNYSLGKCCKQPATTC